MRTESDVRMLDVADSIDMLRGLRAENNPCRQHLNTSRYHDREVLGTREKREPKKEDAEKQLHVLVWRYEESFNFRIIL